MLVLGILPRKTWVLLSNDNEEALPLGEFGYPQRIEGGGMANKKIKVLDPTSKAESKELWVQRRPIDLEGKVLGIVWNRKLGGDVFLDRLGQLLMERFHFSEIVNVAQKADSPTGLSADLIRDVSEKCGAVIIGVGD